MRTVRKMYEELVSIKHLCGYSCLSKYLLQVLSHAPAIAASRSLIPADAAMGGRSLLFNVFREEIVLNGELIGAARELYGRKVYFALPDFHIRPGDVVVDLGANAGVFTTLAARLARRVIAVEAQSEFVDCIRTNLRRNSCEEKAAVVFGLIGSGAGLLSDRETLESASHYNLPPPSLTMDGLLREHGVGVVNFLKVDIEGSEFDLFFNDNGWLSRVERIAMEVHLQFGDAGALSALLDGRGFDVVLLDNRQRVVTRLEGAGGYLFARSRRRP